MNIGKIKDWEVFIEAPTGYDCSSCNLVITECAVLHAASAWADYRTVTIRAMACESDVALNPWLAVWTANCRYVPSLLACWDCDICCCQKRQDHITFPSPVSFFLSALTLWRTFRAAAESDVRLCRDVLARNDEPDILPKSGSLLPPKTFSDGQRNLTHVFHNWSYPSLNENLRRKVSSSTISHPNTLKLYCLALSLIFTFYFWETWHPSTDMKRTWCVFEKFWSREL